MGGPEFFAPYDVSINPAVGRGGGLPRNVRWADLPPSSRPMRGGSKPSTFSPGTGKAAPVFRNEIFRRQYRGPSAASCRNTLQKRGPAPASESPR